MTQTLHNFCARSAGGLASGTIQTRQAAWKVTSEKFAEVTVKLSKNDQPPCCGSVVFDTGRRSKIRRGGTPDSRPVGSGSQRRLIQKPRPVPPGLEVGLARPAGSRPAFECVRCPESRSGGSSTGVRSCTGTKRGRSPDGRRPQTPFENATYRSRLQIPLFNRYPLSKPRKAKIPAAPGSEPRRASRRRRGSLYPIPFCCTLSPIP